MSQRKRSAEPKRSPREQPAVMTILNPNAAGIDVHSDMHMVCVPLHSVKPSAPSGRDGLSDNVRRFGANSCDLVAIADWLKECGVTTVAMESTGVYWIPLFELLASRGFEVWLVEPGLTGQRIIETILQGERNPHKLAHLRDPKCKNSVLTIAKALHSSAAAAAAETSNPRKP